MALSQSAQAAAIRAEAMKRPKKPKAGEGGDGRPLAPTDNLTPEQKLDAAFQMEEAQLMSVMDRLKRTRSKEADEKKKVDEAKQVLKEAQTAVTRVFTEAKLLNPIFTRDNLEEHYRKAIVEKGVRKDQQKDEERRARWRRWWSLPVADSRQQELDAALPETAKTAQDYESEGYKAGLNSEERKAPAIAVKEGHDQAWLTGYDAGTARKAWGLTNAKTIPLPTNAAGTKMDQAKPDEPAKDGVEPPKPDNFEEDDPEALANQAGRRQPEEAV